MEPTIYKPSIYNGPTLYNGAGGIYNGGSVYKDGAGGGVDIIYETDFSNFDFVNKIDYPLIGEPQEYTLDSSAFELSNILIDGETYSSIHHTSGNKNIRTQFSAALQNVDLFTIETKIYKHSIGSLATNDWAYMQFWNNQSSKNIGVPSYQNERMPNGYGITFNGGGVIDWSLPYTILTGNVYMPDDSSLRNLNGICIGGVTVDKLNNLLKIYLKNKKFMIIKNISDTSYDQVSYWFGSIVNIYLLGITIIKKDLFEEME